MTDGGSTGVASRRSPAVSLLTPALLVAVAITQLFLAQVHGLSPWKGGGFGMFASVDRAEQRVLRIELEGADGARPVDVDAVAELSDRDTRLVERYRTLPTPGAARALGERLTGFRWEVGADDRLVPLDPHADVTVGTTTDGPVHLEVWRVVYDGDGQVTLDLLARRTVGVAGPS